MFPERTGYHQSGEGDSPDPRAHHSTRVPEPKVVHPCMFSEVEVLEGSVSKKAVFSGQVGETM